jgi:hypothetical protein
LTPTPPQAIVTAEGDIVVSLAKRTGVVGAISSWQEAARELEPAA